MKKYQWGKNYIDKIFTEKYNGSSAGSAILWNMINHHYISHQPWSELSQKINNKVVYTPTNIQCALILDICNQELKRVYNIKYLSRNDIIYNIKSMLKDNINLRIYRKDIHHFYESIDCEYLKKEIENNDKISFISQKFILEFLSYCIDLKIGLPRGIALSSTLAEIFAFQINNIISNDKNVIFYSRYVDDIFILCPYDNNLQLDVDRLLKPIGNIELKKEKAKNYELELQKGQFLSQPMKFTFLGYEFTIHDEKDPKKYRKVNLDLSPHKINRFKEKIKKSFLNYEKTRDFTLLKKRIIFLTHNYIMNKKLTKGQIKAGIYFSYPYANPEENGSLYNLDKFLQICIYNSTLSKNQKKEVYKRTFTHGFKNKTILTYKYVEFMKITTIWKNG